MSKRTPYLRIQRYGVLAGPVVPLLSVLALLCIQGCSQTLYYADGSGDSNPETSSTDTREVEGEKDGICGARAGQLFGDDYPWNQTVDDRPLDDESDAVIDYLDGAPTWSGLFDIAGADGAADTSYGMAVLVAGEDAPRVSFDIREDAFWTPHCDFVRIPMPAGGAVEGEEDYECRHDGNCHLVVLDKDACLLYEMYRASRTDDSFRGGCLALWDLTEPYTPTLRGDCCTSAEAAGLPIAPLTFSADDIAKGEISHAIRFSLPNEHVRGGAFVRPATHTAEETYGGPDAPPRGARLRLKEGFSNPDLSPAALVVVTALKKYGMILTDPGYVTFTAEDERFTVHSWAEVGVDSSSLARLMWSDFEVVDGKERFRIDGCRCERTAINE